MARRKAAETEVVNEGEPVRFMLNKVARNWFGDKSSARVRIQDGVLLILPSTRTKGLGNLPSGDRMIELSVSEASIRFTVNLPKQLEKGTIFTLERMNYGWFKLNEVQDGASPAKDDGVARVVG